MPSFLAQRLASTDLFADLDVDALEALVSAGTTMTYRAGAPIVEQGKSDRALFLLLEGDADVEVSGERAGSMAAGTYFGEIALIDGATRSATVRAGTSGAKALVISALTFGPLVRERPEIAQCLLVAMARKIRSLEADRVSTS
jgi:CRP-like cAMP-binding protein